MTIERRSERSVQDLQITVEAMKFLSASALRILQSDVNCGLAKRIRRRKGWYSQNFAMPCLCGRKS